MKLERVLVPTDFSPCADQALEYALMLAERFSAIVTVLHVWEVPQGIGIESMPFVAMQGTVVTLMDFVRTEAEKSLAELVARLEQRGVKVESRLVAGYAPMMIIEAQSDFDLIVMGTHGRGVVAHFLLGSVAERVVRKAKIPVLTLRSD